METITIIKTSENGETTTEEAQVQETTNLNNEVIRTITIIEPSEHDYSNEEHSQQIRHMEHQSDSNWETPRLVHWNESAALLLLSIYRDNIQEFASPFTKKKVVWQKIADLMNSSHGYGVTDLQCENKIKSLTVAYKKALDSNSNHVARSQAVFKEMEEIFGRNPTMHRFAGEEELPPRYKKKRKIDIPEWASRMLDGADERHKKKMEKYDKIIALLDRTLASDK
ncbi:uncharacterized protein [Parasteatoda tepidariorum]|nr:uncharacterized protein LOC107453246 isoform X2 [Parasteatoda tepidariorum]XP_015925487.1 uncharacterized protein LOC107453246 isoform X2 [Parasteatoda tepidariorum]XP_015925488.1 uncharacterized protein LOC107453246 isoform X2 [Parasteatoda tepidariorum]